MASQSPIVIFGATGLTGIQILKYILQTHPNTPITTIGRRAPSQTAPNLTPIIEPDNTKWPSHLTSLDPPPSLIISAVGTTRAQAGGLAAQWKIDHDLNISIVNAAKKATSSSSSSSTFLFVSSAGVRGLTSGLVPYSKMKVGVEDAIIAAGFDHAVIMRPAALIGEREQTRSGEGFVQTVLGGWMGKIGMRDSVAVDAEVVGRAAARCVEEVEKGAVGEEKKVWEVGNGEILKLGRDEWKGEQ